MTRYLHLLTLQILRKKRKKYEDCSRRAEAPNLCYAKGQLDVNVGCMLLPALA